MFSVALQVPSNDKETPISIINYEELNQIFNTCGKDILNPDFCTWGDGKVNRVSSVHSKDASLSLDEFEF